RRERASAEKKAAALYAQADKMRAKATKAVAAQNMAKRADRMLAGLSDKRVEEKVANLRFPTPVACGKVRLTASGLTKSDGATEVLTAVHLAMQHCSREVVIGFNAAGTATLLRRLPGYDEPDAGVVEPGYGLKLGYYAQEPETLDTSQSLLDSMKSAAPNLD